MSENLPSPDANRIRRLTIRWTIGDVSEYGFAALHLSVWGIWRLLGNEPNYVTYVNTIPLILAKARTGELPSVVTWRDVTSEFPTFLQLYFDQHKTEGVGRKFAPLRLNPGCSELASDNDCILWEPPQAVWKWLQTPGSFLFAEDVQACFGQFSEICGTAPRNSGIRGLPAGFDLEEAMIEVLRKNRFTLSSELDEQGLQTAIMQSHNPYR